MSPAPAQSGRTLELVRRIRDGDTSAWERLFLQHGARLLVYISLKMEARLKAFAEPADVLQEVYLTAFQEMSRFRGEEPGAFYLWLKGIARNHLRNLRRTAAAKKRAALRRLPTESGALPLPRDTQTPSRQVARSEEVRGLLARLQRLEPAYRSVLFLRFYEGLTAPQVARTLRITPDAVYQRLHRALAALGRA